MLLYILLKLLRKYLIFIQNQFKMKNRILLLLFISMIALSCNHKISDMDKQQIESIKYRFKDSSTPPRFHRSYTITVYAEKVDVSVDVYGTTLADETYKIEPSVLKNLIDNTDLLDPPRRKITNGATGTKGYTISISGNGKSIYKLYWDSLQEVGEGTGKFKDMVRAVVPNLSELTSRKLPERDEG